MKKYYWLIPTAFIGMYSLSYVFPQTKQFNNCRKLTTDSNHNIKCAIQEARDVMPEHKILADLMAAQAIHESRLNGKPSALAVQGNNLFGIKGKGNCGSVTMRTFEYGKKGKYYISAAFAHYCTLTEGFLARKALYDKPRYKNLYESKSFEDAAHRIYKSGYATDPLYPKYLIVIYNKYIDKP